MTAATLCGALALGACDSNASAQNGDTVIIDFAGFLGDVQFEGGTATGFPLKLGSGQFVPGFEEQLVGMEKVRHVILTSHSRPSMYRNWRARTLYLR